MATPYALIEFEEIESTQDEASRHAGETPVLVVAARQSAGRGRQGRVWLNAPRGVAGSLALRPTGWKPEQFPRLSLVAALAGRTVLGEDVACKWPNDLIRNGDKVAGLLLEAAGGTIVVGMGVNLWWSAPPDGFGSLLDADPGPGLGREIAERWARDLLARIELGPERWGRMEYRRACRTLGRTIRWRPDGEGTACDVDEEGRLVVETNRGRVKLAAGEVWEVR